MMRYRFLSIGMLLAAAICISCTPKPLNPPDEPPTGEVDPPGDIPPENDENGNEKEEDDGDIPAFDDTIRPYDGERADDADEDITGSDKDFYWEANNFKNKLNIVYNGPSVSVSGSDNGIEWHTDGAHVVIDMQTNAVSSVELVVSGKSEDGSLKIYGGNKYKLTLAGVDLTTARGPAINSQCKKRVYVHLADGSTNRLTDSATYREDIWYLDPAAADSEDRKGAFFSEGHLIFSGTGVLVVAGKQKHGIVTDGYLFTRPGVTLAVTEAAKNAVHVKGDATDGIGIRITGGLIYANVASPAGKGMKTDLDIEISGGKLDLNTSGSAVYEADAQDVSSPSGIKADGNIFISGGRISAKTTGAGGKGLSADGDISISGGEITLATSGKEYVYTSAMTASPKGMKADGNITIDGGRLNISVSGASEASEGMESKAELTVNDGELFVYAYDDAINAAEGITVNGGRIYAYSSNNDGIDSNGYLHLNGGLVIASGGSGPEESFDCDNGSKFLINGGTLIGTAGNCMNAPSSSSRQRVVIYGGLSLSKDDKIAILDSSGKPLAAYDIPRSMSKMVLFFSSPEIVSGGSYTIRKGGTLLNPDEHWNGWYDGGSWTGGSQIGSFTSNNVITTVGVSGSGPGGGGPGGRPGGW